MEHNALYTLTGKVKLRQVLPYSIQQILAMFVTNIVPIGMVGAAASPALSQAEILSLIQNAIIVAGIATFVQATPVWKFGSGLPVIMGLSFTFIVPLTAVAARHGYGAVIGTVLAGGLFEIVLGLTVRYWHRAIAPIVSAVVVTGIGLSLLPTAARSFGGGYVENFGSVPYLLTGAVTLLTCLVWSVFAKGAVRQLSILVGLGVGYVTALLLGVVDFSGVTGSGWFALPRILPYAPVFRLDAILSICVIYLVSATETLGDVSAVTAGALRREPLNREVSGALAIDGLGSAISGLFGCTPVTSYSENVGLTIMTGVINRRVNQLGAAILVAAGFFPPVGGLISTVPKPVIGAMLLMVLGQILASGFEMIARAGFTPRNKLIVAISLSVAISFTTSTEAGIWNSFPVAVQSIFSQNIVAVIFVLAFLLNLLLPRHMKDE